MSSVLKGHVSYSSYHLVRVFTGEDSHLTTAGMPPTEYLAEVMSVCS